MGEGGAEEKEMIENCECTVYRDIRSIGSGILGPRKTEKCARRGGSRLLAGSKGIELGRRRSCYTAMNDWEQKVSEDE